MTIRAHEQVKLNDFNAHLEVIKNNIRIANQELEHALAEKESYIKHGTSLAEKIAEKYTILESLDKDIKSKEAYIVLREEVVTKEELRLKKDREEFEQYINIRLSDISVKEQSFEQEYSLKKEEHKKLTNILNGLKEQIEIHITKNDEYVYKQYELSAEYKILGNKVILKREELDNFEKDIVNKKKELTKELNDLQEEVEEERKKIELPRKNLEDEKKILEIKQKDITILTNRLRKLYKEQGVEISII